MTPTTRTTTARIPVLLIALLLGVSLVAGAGQLAATATVADPGAASRGVVAQSPQGSMKSRIVGETAGGRQVTGKFVPLTFIERNGKLKVRGLLQGKVQRPNGDRTFAAVRTLTVKSINGEPARGRTATSPRAACNVLNLVLGPLDLDLLGLEISLDRVVLDIVARSGAGKLLGNLVCAVAGLLDGGIGGALGRLINLLNRILGQLGLGI